MIVCIAEKPSVAQDIARIIGANSRKDGYMETLGEYIAQLVQAHHDCMVDLPEKHIQLGEVPGHYSSWVTEEQQIKNDTQKFAKQNGYNLKI